MNQVWSSLKTDRLTIRRMEAGDWESIKYIWEDFDRSEFAQYDAPHASDEDEIKSQVRNMAEESRGEANLFFCVFLDGMLIGYADFHDTGAGMDVGYCFHSDYHGKGYAKESCQALIRYFQDKGVRRFTAGTAMKNILSVKLLQALGFQKTGDERVSFYKNEAGEDIFFDGGLFEFKG